MLYANPRLLKSQVSASLFHWICCARNKCHLEYKEKNLLFRKTCFSWNMLHHFTDCLLSEQFLALGAYCKWANWCVIFSRLGKCEHNMMPFPLHIVNDRLRVPSLRQHWWRETLTESCAAAAQLHASVWTRTHTHTHTHTHIQNSWR